MGRDRGAGDLHHRWRGTHPLPPPRPLGAGGDRAGREAAGRGTAAMTALLRVLLLLAVAALPATAPPTWGVEPDALLADPVLAQRASNLSAELRCRVCPTTSVDSYNATTARDLRLLM